MELLNCTSCELSLPKESFTLAKKTTRGYQYKCKNCAKIYNEQNKDKQAQQQRERNKHNIEYRRKRSKEYELKNKEKLAAARKATKQKNIEKIRAYWKTEKYKQKAKLFREQNREYLSLKNKEWRKNNRGYLNHTNAIRKSKIKMATPKWLTEKHRQEIAEYYIICKELAWLSLEELQVDHIVPIKGKDVCGLHVPWNLQILPASENIAKKNKFGNYPLTTSKSQGLI